MPDAVATLLPEAGTASLRPRRTPVPEFDFVLFGATGDLSIRKLLPALLQRESEGVLPSRGRIICVGRQALTTEAFITRALGAPDPASERFRTRITYQQVDATDLATYPGLAGRLDDPSPVRVYYLATAPNLFAPICQNLAASGLVTAASRVVLEKPVGHDLASARAINDAVGRIFAETQTYRIDHYLGKETVQNLMVLRFGNTLFERVWSSSDIDHVQITAAETVGVEGRGGYYDHAGALRDMVQNHLMQLLCLVAMEPPAAFDKDAMRDEKIKVLRALAPITGDHVAGVTVRGQYSAGAIDGAPVPGYLKDLGAEDSDTETFVALKVEVRNWRWAGVPFFLRTGKRMPQRTSEIVVTFKPVPHSIFGAAGAPVPNQLVIRLQPDEGISLVTTMKAPGSGRITLVPASLRLSFRQEFRDRASDAYERLITDVIRGDPTLFMRRDEVEASWRWIEPILEGWQARRIPPRPYAAGTWGPSAAIALVEREGRTWYENPPS